MRFAVLDPAIVIWDIDEFKECASKYWEIASDCIEIFDLVEAKALTLVANQELIDEMLLAFPAEYLDHGITNVRDFSNAVYSFFSKVPLREERTEGDSAIASLPDITERSHFPEVVCACTRHALSVATQLGEHVVFLGHHRLIDGDVDHIRIHIESDRRDLPAYCSTARYRIFRDLDRRVFEMIEKHDSRSGFGSRVPASLRSEDLQALLDIAIEISGPRALAAYSEKADTPIIFRLHRPNTYHGYPCPAEELGRVGTHIAALPRR